MLDTAILVAAELGWDAITPALLARQTGVSKSEISMYLGDKYEIQNAVAEREMKRVADALCQVSTSRKDHRRLRDIAEAFLDDRTSAECRSLASLAVLRGDLDGPTYATFTGILAEVVGKHAPALAAAWVGIIRHTANSPRIWSPAEIHSALYRAGLGFLAQSQKGPTF